MTDEEKQTGDFCNTAIWLAMDTCQKRDVDAATFLDRIYTFAAAQAVAQAGKLQAAKDLRRVADAVEGEIVDEMIRRSERPN